MAGIRRSAARPPTWLQAVDRMFFRGGVSGICHEFDGSVQPPGNRQWAISAVADRPRSLAVSHEASQRLLYRSRTACQNAFSDNPLPSLMLFLDLLSSAWKRLDRDRLSMIFAGG